MAPNAETAHDLNELPILDKVGELRQILLEPSGANIETASISVHVEPIGSVHRYHDMGVLESPYTEEIAGLKEMQAVIDDSNRFISMTYCYRSCSKALPMMKNESDDEARKRMHQRTFSILRPEIAKLQEFSAFHEVAIGVLIQHCKKLAQSASKGQVVSDDHIRLVQKVFDRLIILDALKDMKACLQNDFARYKRSFSNIRADLVDSDAVADDIHNLQMFLGNPQHPNDLIITRLRSELQKISGYEEVIILLADDALRSLESRVFLLPDEKHVLERVLINSIFLFDGESKRMSNAFKFKKFNIEGIRSYFRGRPYLPLFGDMHLNIKFVLKRCTNYDATKMESQWITGDQSQYLLENKQQIIQAEYNAFSTSFLHVLNAIKARSQGHDDTPIDRATTREVFDRVLQGFEIISKWNTAIKEQSAFKRANPVNMKTFTAMGGVQGPGFNFECVDRFNYSSHELTVLCDVLSMLKGVGSMLEQAESFLSSVLRRSMHDDLQEYLQSTIAQPLRKAYKRGKDDIRTMMCLMRWVAADWSRDTALSAEYKTLSKDLKTTSSVDFPKRCVQPTHSQIFLLRRLSLQIYSEKSKGMQGGMFSEKNIGKELLPEFERFYNRLFFFPYLLDYKGSLSSCLDMSDLWYREFYLEIAKCVQFPISMSLPFILAEHVVNTPYLANSLLFCVDIYNDAAVRALTDLGQQFIFREVEAELNLAFNTLVHTLAMNVFACFKAIASSILLDHDQKRWLEARTHTWRKYDPSASGYIALLGQRDVRLLGRSVDLRRLLSQHINVYFRQNIDMVITRFESSDLTTIIDLKSILNQTQLAHRLLSSFLSLDSYETAFIAVNGSSKFPPFCGRILIHIYSELLGDVIPNFCLDTHVQMFRKGPVPFVDPPPRDSPPPFMPQFWYTGNFNKPFADALKLSRDFFGPDHILALLSFLDSRDFGALFEKIYSSIEEKVNFVFASYAKVLIDSMDPIKLPSLKYGVIGGYGYFDLKLKPLAGYDNLRSELFQTIREIGNSLALVHQLSYAQYQGEIWDSNMATYLAGTNRETSPLSNILKEILSDETIPPRLQQVVHQTEAVFDTLHRRTTSSLLTITLERLYTSIEKSNALNEWIGKPAANGFLDLETPRDLCRLWSAMQFIFLTPTQGQIDGIEPCDREVFGDGFSWAGISLLHLCGFRSRFEALDFAYYVLRMQLITPANLAIDPKKNKKGKTNPEQELFPFVKKLLEDGSSMKLLNSYLFSIFEAHFGGFYRAPVKTVVPEKEVPVQIPSLSTLSTGSFQADSTSVSIRSTSALDSSRASPTGPSFFTSGSISSPGSQTTIGYVGQSVPSPVSELPPPPPPPSASPTELNRFRTNVSTPLSTPPSSLATEQYSPESNFEQANHPQLRYVPPPPPPPPLPTSFGGAVVPVRPPDPLRRSLDGARDLSVPYPPPPPPPPLPRTLLASRSAGIERTAAFQIRQNASGDRRSSESVGSVPPPPLPPMSRILRRKSSSQIGLRPPFLATSASRPPPPPHPAASSVPPPPPSLRPIPSHLSGVIPPPPPPLPPTRMAPPLPPRLPPANRMAPPKLASSAPKGSRADLLTDIRAGKALRTASKDRPGVARSNMTPSVAPQRSWSNFDKRVPPPISSQPSRSHSRTNLLNDIRAGNAVRQAGIAGAAVTGTNPNSSSPAESGAHLLSGTRSGKAMAAAITAPVIGAIAPPAPPPLPPQLPSSLSGKPKLLPKSTSSPVNRANLLSDIRSGKTLKKSTTVAHTSASNEQVASRSEPTFGLRSARTGPRPSRPPAQSKPMTFMEEMQRRQAQRKSKNGGS